MDRDLDEFARFGIEDRAAARGRGVEGGGDGGARGGLGGGGALSSTTQLNTSTSTPGMTRL